MIENDYLIPSKFSMLSESEISMYRIMEEYLKRARVPARLLCSQIAWLTQAPALLFNTRTVYRL